MYKIRIICISDMMKLKTKNKSIEQALVIVLVILYYLFLKNAKTKIVYFALLKCRKTDDIKTFNFDAL